MKDNPLAWTKEEYLAHLRRSPGERGKESRFEKWALYLIVFPFIPDISILAIACFFITLISLLSWVLTLVVISLIIA